MISLNVNNSLDVNINESEIKKIINKASRKERKIKGEIEINIIGDALIRKLNREYRGKDKITDVLSFAWTEDKKVKSHMLGQIYICYPQIKRQAKNFKVSVNQEFFRLLAHGLLHLAGYDHVDKKEAGKMFALQEEIIKDIK